MKSSQSTRPGATGAAPHQKPRAVDLIAEFVSRNRTVLSVVLGAIVVAAVALFVVFSVQAARVRSSLEAVETLQQSYDEWLALGEVPFEIDADVVTTTAAQAERYPELQQEVEQIASRFAGMYAARRALLIGGDALFELGRWEEAAAEYERAVAAGRPSYLTPIALLRAAIALESAERYEAALAVHRRIVTDFADTSADAPRAMFAIGRLSERLNRLAEAAQAYRQLIENYPASSWTSLARTRIITLTAQGRIGG